MPNFRTILGTCVAFFLGIASAVAAERPGPDPDLAPFSTAEFIAGIRPDPVRCAAYKTAVWVVVDGRPECVRYFLAGENAGSTEALVWMHGDFARMEKPGQYVPPPFYGSLTAAGVSALAKRFATAARMTGIVLARPGTMGSSGFEPGIRHTAREARIIAAALDAIKARHKLSLFHIGGQSGGGGMAAAMINMRSDVGCAVLASGDAAMIEALRDNGVKTFSRDDLSRLYDASAQVRAARKNDRLRIFVLTDPADERVSQRSQAIYVSAARTVGLPVRQIVTAAADPHHHDLSRQGIWAMEDCALGFTDAHLEAGVLRIAEKARQVATADETPKQDANRSPR